MARRVEYVKRCREQVTAKVKEMEETRRREAEEKKKVSRREVKMGRLGTHCLVAHELQRDWVVGLCICLHEQ